SSSEEAISQTPVAQFRDGPSQSTTSFLDQLDRPSTGGNSLVRYRASILYCNRYWVFGFGQRACPLARHREPLAGRDRSLAFHSLAGCHPVGRDKQAPGTHQIRRSPACTTPNSSWRPLATRHKGRGT